MRSNSSISRFGSRLRRRRGCVLWLWRRSRGSAFNHPKSTPGRALATRENTRGRVLVRVIPDARLSARLITQEPSGFWWLSTNPISKWQEFRSRIAQPGPNSSDATLGNSMTKRTQPWVPIGTANEQDGPSLVLNVLAVFCCAEKHTLRATIRLGYIRG